MLGQNAYHPRLITGILIYAYNQGIFSSREIEKKCNEDLLVKAAKCDEVESGISKNLSCTFWGRIFL
ncbi:MAG: transposase [Deltaproteobacteria bacterium]|nr:transposase [Deltaproteobacteria bacterium]